MDIPTAAVIEHGSFGVGTYFAFQNESEFPRDEAAIRLDFGLFDRVEIGLSSVRYNQTSFLTGNLKLLLLREAGTVPNVAVGVENIGDEIRGGLDDLTRYERKSAFLAISKTFNLPRVHQIFGHIGIGNHRFTEEIGMSTVLNGVFLGISKDFQPSFARGDLTFSLEVDGRGINAGVRHRANSGLQVYLGAEALNAPATDGKEIRYIAGVSWSNQALMKRIEEAKRLAKQAGILANEAKKAAKETHQKIETESKMVEPTSRNSEQNTLLPERTVTFPEDYSIGMLYIRDWDAKGAEFFSQWVWKKLGPAQGNVTVPAGQKLGLEMQGKDATHFAALAKLGADDLHALTVWGIDDDSTQFIGHLSWLETLIVYESPRLSDEGMTNLFGLLSLDFLALFNCDKLDIAFSVLAKLPRLTAMELGGIALTDRAVRELSQLPHLEFLWMEYMQIKDTQFITNFTLPPSLRDLGFGACEDITDATLKHIAELYRNATTPLTGFSVRRMPVSESATASVLRSMPASKVDSLAISHTLATADILDEIGGMVNLEELFLAGVPITDTEVEYLEPFAKLESLDLSQTQITNQAVESLGKIRSLQRVDIRETGITPDFVEKLKAALPECEIIYEGRAPEWW